MNNWNADFLEWLKIKDKIYFRFNELANIFEGYLIEFFFVDKEKASNIAKNFGNMTGKCNIPNIYDYENATEAYAILHFLDRYYRFNLIYLRLIELGLLPIEKNQNTLDIGTGPAPAIFALSDILMFVNEFAYENNIEFLKDISVQYEAIEKSENFNYHWLHHFVEYANYSTSTNQWNVPYFASFTDFSEIDFKRMNYDKENWQLEKIYKQYGNSSKYSISRKGNEISVYGRNFMWGGYVDKRKNTYRYNLISFSNFLTELEQVKTFKNQIKGTAFSLRNNGIVLIVGAIGNEYPEIYEKLRAFLKINKKSGQDKRIVCNEVLFELMSYEPNNMFSKRIKQSYEFFLDKFKHFELDELVEKKVLKQLDKYINEGKTEKLKKWNIQVFKKEITEDT